MFIVEASFWQLFSGVKVNSTGASSYKINSKLRGQRRVIGVALRAAAVPSGFVAFNKWAAAL